MINGETIYTVYGLSGAILYRDNVTTGIATDYIRMGGQSIARIKSSGETSYLHADHLGSPVAATDAAGNLLWRETFTPFGESLNPPVANTDQDGFTGHIRDTDTGLTYMQARYYDPVIGRFLSNDPVGFAAGGVNYFNRYSYTANDPVNMTDPTGMCGTRLEGRSAIGCETIGPGPEQRQTLEAPGTEGPGLTPPARRGGGSQARARHTRNALCEPDLMARMGPGGLQAHENGIGHTLREHVGRSNQQLSTRLSRDARVTTVSTFTNLPKAQFAARETIALPQNARAINQWLSSGGHGSFQISRRFREPVGVFLPRGTKRPFQGNTANFVLRSAPNQPGGFQIITGFVSY